MGIDLYVDFPGLIFPFEDTAYESMKWALAETKCNFVELFMDYNYNLYLVFDNAIHYWSEEQVLDMYYFLERLYKKKLEVLKEETDYNFKNKKEDKELLEHEYWYHKKYLDKYCLEDIRMILDYFRIVVDNKGRIIVS